MLSIASTLTRSRCSHSNSLSNSRVMVPNLRTCSPSGVRRQATTVFLCRSSPQQRSTTTSMTDHPPWLKWVSG